ncbi:MAG: hypothetical protein M3512_08655 [Bacteroidota bacterium]|nr:hypothetical protein [Bacteroidota bacterium]
MTVTNKHHSFFLFLIPALGSLAIYIAIAYFLQREDSYLLIIGYILLFLAYLSFVFNATTNLHVYWLVNLSIIFRFSFLLAIPNLSDDFYRFIWDGRLILNEVHPFSFVPHYLISLKANLAGITEELYAQLNSPHYFTIYPPVCQAIFTIAAVISPNSMEGAVISMRVFIIAAEIGSLIMIIKTLKLLGKSIKKVIFYALNPLVILELTGNLHFEAIMIFFLITSFYFFHKGNLIASAGFFSLAVCTKLIPLIFLPLIIKRVGIKKAIAYFALVGALCYLMFLPFLSPDFLKGFSSSFLYYFSRFEFNASIYYLIREAGKLFFDVNVIVVAGAFLALAVMVLIFIYAKKEKIDDHNIFESCMWVLLIFLMLTTTLHPWYIIPLLSLSIFTKYRFSILWTFFIFLTYLNYTSVGYHENLLVVFFEYLFVITFLVFEIKYYREFQVFKQSIRKKFIQSVASLKD